MAVLKRGSRESEVKEIQSFLGLKADGIFGRDTHNAVLSFQREHNLAADGKVGRDTLKALRLAGMRSVSTPSPSVNIPKGNEMLSEKDVRAIIEANRHKLICPPNENNPRSVEFDPDKHLVVVAIRGFKLNMGASGKNDRRIYDDAHFIVTPRGMLAFDGNTDPNGWRVGYGYGSGKGMACLDEGVWFYGRGLHKGRPAFRQACPFRVIRDGRPPYSHTGYHAINWHDGGYSSTSSLGCQTNKPDDFKKLREFIYKSLEDFDNPKMYLDYKSYGLCRAFPYILIDETERRKGNLTV